MFARSRIIAWGTNGDGSGQARRVTALIDPGSDKSIISFYCLPQYIQFKIKQFQNNPHAKNPFNIRIHNNIRICTITNDIKQDCISLTAQVELGEWTGDCDFIVLSKLKNHSLILGADFFKRHQAVIDYGNEEIRFRPGSSPLAQCKAFKNTVIPPYSVTNIKATLSRMSVNRVVTIEPFDHTKQGFAIANSVNKVDSKGNSFIQIANPSGKSIRIHRGQPLAHASVVQLSDSSSSSDIILNIETQLDSLNINKNLDDGQRASVLDVVRRYKHVFSWNKNDLGLTNMAEHTIDLTTDIPVKSAPYKTQPAKQKIIDDQINNMLDQNIIECSKSPFASPVVLAKKKSGEWRFCVDFRSLNNVTVKDAYPLPRMDDTLQALHGNSFFSTLDLLSGFWQIPVDVADRYKTAFVTRGGLYQFRVMPFGLTNAPATFQRLMDRVLLGLNWRACVVYLDDIIVFGRTIEEHNTNLALVLEKIGQANLKLKPDKCIFAVEEVVYLGHRINKHGVGTDNSKVEAIGRIETPTDRVKLKRFLGACSFYRRFVKNFSQIALPLYKLTSYKVEFVWTDVHQSAFDELKRALTNTPMLVSPNFSKPFRVYCDASKLSGAMGAVLEQDHGVIAYASQHFTPAENKYTINEKEALAILWSSRHFKPYIYGQRVTFFTDHKPLADLKMNRAPEEPLGRLMLKLQGLNYDIRYVRGADNTVADLLSRDVIRNQPDSVDVNNNVSTNTIRVEAVDWSALQRADDQLAKVIESVTKKDRSSITGSPFYQFFSRLRLDGDVLMFCKRVVVPFSSRKSIISDHHQYHGHEQASKLFSRLNDKYYWPKMAEDIKSFVGACDVCQRTKTRVLDVAEQGHIVDVDEMKPLSFWSVDLQGPYHTTRRGKRYIIVAVDYLTKWVEIACLRDATAVSTARFLVDNIILRHGVPEGMSILSDQGSNFESKLIKELCELYNIKKFRSSPYHPAGNGAVERENRSIKEALRSYTLTSQSDWDEYIPQIAHTRNTTVHRSTGFSPYEMVYGFKLDQADTIKSSEYASEFVQKLQTIKQRIANVAVDRIRATRNKQQKSSRVRFNFQVGDLVLLTNEATHEGLSKKLEPKRQGPYEIIAVIGTRNYRIRAVKGNYEKVVHHNRLMPYVQS